MIQHSKLAPILFCYLVFALIGATVVHAQSDSSAANQRSSTSSLDEIDLLFAANMPAWSLGDFFFSKTLQSSGASVGLPNGGRIKISDNNMAIPLDRVFFTFNHFHNALDTVVTDGITTTTDSSSVEQYTFGMEKVLPDGISSIEIRMPLMSEFSSGVLDTGGGGGGGLVTRISAGGVGNLAVTYKLLLYSDLTTAWSTGLGVTTPTGSTVSGIAQDDPFRIESQAVDLMPFLGVVVVPDERRFLHGFVQLDVPVSGNEVTVGAITQSIRDDTLLFVDVSAGYWLFRQPEYVRQTASGLTGVAALLELHYTTSVDPGDPLPPVIVGGPEFVSGSIDILNLTTGIHAEFGQSLALRVAAGFPLEQTILNTNGVQSVGPFDSELQASVVYRF